MNQNPLEYRASKPNAKEFLNTHPDFKKKANEISAVLGYNRKMYALGVFELYKEGKYKGYACGPGKNQKVNFWEDYIRSVGSGFAIRQLELNVSNKLDEYTGGRDEVNYDTERDHYILYETRKLKDESESNGNLHIDTAESIYLYETGKREVDKIDIKNQADELIESMRLPQGSITERYYLKHSRRCPLEEFLKACVEADGANNEIHNINPSQINQVNNFFKSHSYRTFTDAGDFVDKEKYDYVLLPNKNVIILNKDVLLDPETIAEKELAESENVRLEELYAKYLTQNTNNTIRGTEEDLKQFTDFLQSL